MKFFSKVSNYRVVLKHGLPGNSVLGTPPMNGKSVKFEGGVAYVPDSDTETIELLKASPSYNLHFVSDEAQSKDPFANTRKDSEPVHIIQTLKHGSVESQMTSKPILSQQEIIVAAAKTMAAEMMKGMLPDIIAKVKADLSSPVAEAAKSPEEKPVTEKKAAKKVAKTEPVTEPTV